MGHPYATVADMELRYTTVKLNKFPGINIVASADTTLEEFLNEASREMDGYFQKFGYVVPLAPSTPGRAKDVCRHIVFYWIHDLQDAKQVGKKTLNDYLRALEWLMDVAKGEIKLGTDIAVELDDTAQDKAIKSLTKDDLHMTQGNSSEGTGRDSLGEFGLNDKESGATGETT